MASPDAEMPTWFAAEATLLTRDQLAERCRVDDVLLFSCPADAPFVDSLPASRKILHMQGANTPADWELFDAARGYELVSHGLHMTYELQQRGRVAPYVPLGIPEVFRWDGETKTENTVAVMPRKGGDVLDRVRSALPEGFRLIELDSLSEAEVAARLKETDIFLAISPDEAFGLPPLEAMCAGCCVVGYSGVGGFEFMRHKETAHVVPNRDLPALLDALRYVCDSPPYRDGLRQRGMRHSEYYTLEREREYLLRALGLER